MPDRDKLRFDRSSGKRLIGDAYEADFASYKQKTYDQDAWKFERRQHFEEDDPSRDALRAGNWAEALRLLEEDRPGLLEAAEYDRQRGHYFHRLRVVEDPLTPYMQWELHALRMQAECGRKLRVVDADVIRDIEGNEQLPEIVVLGDQALYDVIYSDAGEVEGAVRFTQPELVRQWAHFIEEIYSSAEDMISYFDRHVAQLPPPRLLGG